MSRTVQWLGLVALTALFGLAAVATSPDGLHSGGLWAQALAAGAFLVAPARERTYVILTLAVASAGAFAAGGYPLGVAAGYGAGIAIEALVSARTLTGGWSRPARLIGNRDLGRYFFACVLGGIVGAVAFATTSALASYGTPWKVGAAVLLGHTVSCAVGLGLFTETLANTPQFSPAHRALIWASTIAISLVAFVPNTTATLAFLVIPTLGWMAFNGRLAESVLQIIAVALVVGTLTNQGYGPFAQPAFESAFGPEFQTVPLATFLLACALVAVPLPMSAALQRRSESEAIRERNRSARLVEGAHGTAIIETDETGAITLFNPGAQRIFGYSAEEVRGHTTEMFHTQEEIARKAAELGCEPTYAAIMTNLGEQAGVARDWEVIRKDGVARIVSVIASPVSDENGDFVGYVATADDVTDRLETQDALEAALATEREAVRRLTEVDRVKDRFVSSVSHELRTPITNIVGYLELLMDGVYGTPTPDQERAMSRIDTNSRRLLNLIDDLLTLSRMESAIRPELTPVDLVNVVRRAEEIVRTGLVRRDLVLEVDVPSHAVVVHGDAGQLERMVINLATNAVKFTPDGGRVQVRLVPPADGAGPVIEVEDTGIGIPQADQEMLFSRFFRAAQAREAAVPGSGLGLSITKSIAELHGGQISARSVLGSGSTFRVEFPVGDGADT
ncbi:MAG TPA: ATP-binding protein [Marmoricola sp.]